MCIVSKNVAHSQSVITQQSLVMLLTLSPVLFVGCIRFPKDKILTKNSSINT